MPTPDHAQAKSIRPLPADPNAEWSDPAGTTHGFDNHTARSEGWRYIRFLNRVRVVENEMRQGTMTRVRSDRRESTEP